jgi:hypothetical protein
VNKEAMNMEAVYKAKQHHDNTCPWGGEGKRLKMTHFDIERMSWEEGDTIAGLVIVASPNVASGRFEVECDAEPKNDNVISDLAENKDLVTA